MNLVRILKVVEIDLTIARDSPSWHSIEDTYRFVTCELDLPSDKRILVSGDEVLTNLIEER
jgi:hypothetical protein